MASAGDPSGTEDGRDQVDRCVERCFWTAMACSTKPSCATVGLFTGHHRQPAGSGCCGRSEPLKRPAFLIVVTNQPRWRAAGSRGRWLAMNAGRAELPLTIFHLLHDDQTVFLPNQARPAGRKRCTLSIDLHGSFLVGDRCDIGAGAAAGCRTVIPDVRPIRTGSSFRDLGGRRRLDPPSG